MLLERKNLKYFNLATFGFSNPDSLYFEAGAPRPGQWITLATIFVDSLHVQNPDLPYDLQWLLVHEIEHNLGENHPSEALRDRTPNTPKCSGHPDW
jgi:hypothetical protein